MGNITVYLPYEVEKSFRELPMSEQQMLRQQFIKLVQDHAKKRVL